MRPVQMDRGMVKYAEGSCLIWVGDTQVLCTASVEDRVPPFLKGSGTGWVTAEYAMLPRATSTRQQREVSKGHPSGRTMEIQRLIGRALRSVVELRDLGERTITIDCDVIQADGGTRTASITGAYVALYEALRWMREQGKIRTMPVFDAIAAISVGIVDGQEMLDLCYEEDSRASVDMNVVMTSSDKMVEIQGTAEGMPFTREQMSDLLYAGGVRHPRPAAHATPGARVDVRWPFARRVLTRRELGALGERHAARALRAKGYRILEGNFRTKQGELDLIARDGDTLVIVEVRTRTTTEYQTPLASVNAEKQAQLIRMARVYLNKHKLVDVPCRYDVVEVIATPTGTVRALHHFAGVFIEGM